MKWVFVKDPYYEPLLVFAGWRPVDNLENRLIRVWAKDDVPPATPLNSPQKPLQWQGFLWGTLPIASSILAALLVLIPGRRRMERVEPVTSDREPAAARDDLVLGRLIS